MSLEPVVFGLFLLAAGFILYRALRHGGLRGAMFGASVRRTPGEVGGEGQGPVSTRVKVHLLGEESAPEPAVGLELVAKSFASYQMMPVTLSPSEARKLVALLEQATSAQ